MDMNVWIWIIGTMPIFQNWNFETRYACLTEQQHKKLRQQQMLYQKNHLLHTMNQNVNALQTDEEESDESGEISPYLEQELMRQWLLKRIMIQKWRQSVADERVFMEIYNEPLSDPYDHQIINGEMTKPRITFKTELDDSHSDLSQFVVEKPNTKLGLAARAWLRDIKKIK